MYGTSNKGRSSLRLAITRPRCQSAPSWRLRLLLLGSWVPLTPQPRTLAEGPSPLHMQPRTKSLGPIHLDPKNHTHHMMQNTTKTFTLLRAPEQHLRLLPCDPLCKRTRPPLHHTQTSLPSPPLLAPWRQPAPPYSCSESSGSLHCVVQTPSPCSTDRLTHAAVHYHRSLRAGGSRLPPCCCFAPAPGPSRLSVRPRA